MILVAGKPLLQWILEWLKFNSVSNVVVGVAYRKEKIIDYFGDGKRFGVTIRYIAHTAEGGTSEGFRLAIQRRVNVGAYIFSNEILNYLPEKGDIERTAFPMLSSERRLKHTFTMVSDSGSIAQYQADRRVHCRGVWLATSSTPFGRH
jgi:NDP-sugar pyrophosphorylase family protein